MNNKMTIEKYNPDYFDRVAAIYNASKKDEFLGESKSIKIIPLEDDKLMLDIFRQSTIYIYKTETIVGFAGYTGKTISWLFVDPAYRRQNIARALVNHVLSELDGIVYLNVARSNLAAKSLYKDFGFIVSETFNGRYNGQLVVVDIMELKSGVANKRQHRKN